MKKPASSAAKKSSSFHASFDPRRSSTDVTGPAVPWMFMSDPNPVTLIGRSWRTERGVEPLAEPVPAGIRGGENLRCQHLGEGRDPGGHRDHVVVERARMAESATGVRIEGRHQLAASTERSEGEPSGEVLAECREIGEDAVDRLGAAGRQP